MAQELSRAEQARPRNRLPRRAHHCHVTKRPSGVDVFVHPSSVLHGRNPPPAALVYASSVLTTKLFLRGVVAVEASDLARLNPDMFQEYEPSGLT